jgi:cell division protein FtsW
MDPDDILVEVNPGYDARFVQLVVIAVVVGLVMSFSASYPLAARPNKDYIPGDAFHYFRLHLAYAAVGLGMMALASRARLRDLERLALPGFAVGLVLMVVTVAVYLYHGTTTRGSLLFLDLGPVRFQPSEFAKLFYVVYLASILGQGSWNEKRSVRTRAYLATGALCGLLLLQRDQGMMVLCFCIGLALWFMGGMRLRELLVTLGGAFAGAVLLAMSSAERRERIWAWLDPVKYHRGAGFHTLAMLVATARGWVNGLGLGMSPEKWRQMPEPYTDSIFCVIGGELGLIGCVMFLGLLGWLVYRCFHIGRWSRDSFGYFLACGVGLTYGIQALVNMFVATNLIPVTGLTLPFISYGGSSLISCCIGAGLVLAVHRGNPILRRE